jgi:hypothetical protein
MRNLTSNQHYGGLNKRFERRAALLRRFGFQYRILAPGVATFYRRPYHREYNVPAAAVLHADNRSWLDILDTLLKR